MSKEEVHRTGRLHRAFSVFIFNGNKMLLQKRNVNKYHSGGLWTNACCSHPRAGETLEEAVNRRLQEELGISCDVHELFHFVYFTKYTSTLFEYEYDHVFIGQYDGSFDFDKNEIEELRFISTDELKRQMVKNPEMFSVWFMIAAPKVMEQL